MSEVIKIDSATLWSKGSTTVKLRIPGLLSLDVCRGNGRWPTLYGVGIYLDTDNEQTGIIDWPLPCKPIKFSCQYGDFMVHLDTATEDEILSAKEVAVSFFRDD